MAITRTDIASSLGVCEDAAPVGSQSGSGECWKITREGVVMACKVVRNMSEPERFQREVIALQRINSQRVVRIIGHGEMPTADDGKSHPYLLSEFVPGGDVRANLNAGGPPDDDELRGFIDATLEGLAELHAAEVVHRDLKPENVVLRGSSAYAG